MQANNLSNLFVFHSHLCTAPVSLGKANVVFCVYAGAKVGGWVHGLRSPEEVDLEIEEAEDVSQDQNFGPGSPITPSEMTKSQTKT